jgi:hypothetical protein
MIYIIFHSLLVGLQTNQSLVLETLALRYPLHVLSRGRKRQPLKNQNRMVWILLRRIWQGRRSPLAIVQPAALIRWHRQEFRAF